MTSETLQPIDWQLSVKLANQKPELAKEILSMFIAELPLTRISIQQAHKENDLESLHKHIHKLHGACCYIGVPRIKDIVIQLEDVLKSNNNGNLQTLLSKLENELIAVIDAYKNNTYS